MNKEKFKRQIRKITAFAAAVAMAATFTFPAELGDGFFDGFGNAIVASAETTTYDVNAKTIAGLGTSVIVDPTAPANDTDAWKGSYVYYGNYNGSPVKYRVLDASTTKFGGTTMLLDCDSILYYTPFDNDKIANEDGKKANDWSISDVKNSLNGDGFLNKAGVFTTAEKNAIAASTVEAHPLTTDSATGVNVASTTQSKFGNYVALTGEQIFLLDAEDVSNGAYGYRMTDSNCENHKKTGSSKAYWWLRSADCESGSYAGTVHDVGSFGRPFVHLTYIGVSPALNLNLSSVIFSSVISGTAGATGAEYKLTLLDGDMTIAASGDVTRNGKTVTVPYSISGTNSANATQVSVLILNKEYTAGNTNGATVLDYQKLNVDSFSTSGTGTFALPSGLTGTLGTDYHIYLLAEHVNADNSTDYASEPVKVEKIYLDISEATAVQNGTLTYDGTAQTPTFTVTLGNATLTTDDYDVTVTAQTNAGSYTATITGKGNYRGTISNVTWSIGKATPSVTAPTANTGLVYKGTAQELINKGSTNFGTLLYSLDGTNYSEDVPTATNANSYTVYYKVQGNSNVNDVDAQNFTVSIGKADPAGDKDREINVVRGVGTFTEPTFTGVDGQPLAGKIKYGKYGDRSYNDIVDELNGLDSGIGNRFIPYTFTPNDSANYNGITGEIGFYIFDVAFKVGDDNATAENAVTVKANPTYGDTWAEILTLNTGLKAVIVDRYGNVVPDTEVTTGFSLVIDGVSDTSVKPNAGNYTYKVLFNGTMGGKTYTNHVVASGAVDISKSDRNTPVTSAFELSLDLQADDTYTATINTELTDVEYSFDGTTWSAANTKTSIAHGETVTGYIRYAETGNYNASESNSKTKAAGHDALEHHSAAAATCTTDGNQEYWYCDTCGKYFSDAAGTTELSDIPVIQKKGHNWSSAWETDENYHWHKCLNAGCTIKSGKARHYSNAAATEDSPEVCRDCGYEMNPALGHIHKNHLTFIDRVEPSNCTTDGTEAHYECDCGKLFADDQAATEVTPQSLKIAAHHTPGTEWVSDNDDNHYHVCSVCGEKTDITPHSYDDGVIQTPATEQTTGIKTYTCSICDHTKTEIVPKLDHTHSLATDYSSDATGHWYACSGCTEKVDFEKHTEDSGTVTADGKVFRCIKCGWVIRTEAVREIAKPVITKCFAGVNMVGLNWTSVEGAESYRVYYWADGKWTYAGSRTVNGMYVKNLTAGKKYGFAVKAVAGGKVSKVVSADIRYATPMAALTETVKPAITKAFAAGNGTVGLNWTSVEGAESYRLYYWADGKWTYAGSRTVNGMYVRNLTAGKSYGFAVKAYVNGKYTDVVSKDIVYVTVK